MRHHQKVDNIGQPVRIKSVEITNLRTFLNCRVTLHLPEPAAGQWIVLLGNNGAGKSTFLKAIAMALVDRDSMSRFLQDRNANRYVRRGFQTSGVKVTLDDESLFQVELLSGAPEKLGVETYPYLDGKQSPFIVGYGSLRGRGEITSFSRTTSDQISSLFIPQSPLLDPQVWLIQNRLRYYENTDSNRYQKIIDCLVSLLPEVQTLEVRSSDIEAVFQDGSRAPFASLSDGYLTTAAWVLDMIAAWIETHPSFESDPRSIAEQMTGIALVDEIDLHLHPIWQRSVVNQIRSVFPNMTFVVTTHSPLTILDARPGELFVVDQPSMGEPSVVRQVDLRPGNVDDILTGSWFKLNTTLDTETAQMMEEHRQLLASGATAGDPKVESLETELGKRLDGFGASSVDRMVQSVANEVLSENLESLSEDQKEQARQNLLEAVRKQVKGDQA